MAGIRSLADGHEKIAILTTKPANPAQPTPTELNGGIDAAANILASDWTFGPTDSDTFNERAVAEENNPNAYGPGNGQFGATIFRKFDAATGASDAEDDELFTAMKAKGTTVWVYSRITGKKSADVWAATDEIWYGAEVLLDAAQRPSATGGYIKNRIPGQVQKSYPNITVGAGA